MRSWVLLALAAGCGRYGFADRQLPADDDAAIDGAVVDPDASIDTQPTPNQVTYTATVAECIDPNAPDLTLCTTINGANQLVIDGNDGTTNDPWESYLRFDLDAAIAGRTVTAVHVVLTATDDPKAPGPDGGDVWKVTAFTRAALATGRPTKVGGQPLAPSPGSIDALQVVGWSLPEGEVAASTPVFLGLITTDMTGGVNYWNLSGPNPPQLVIDLAP
jgi:hypothetical protein